MGRYRIRNAAAKFRDVMLKRHRIRTAAGAWRLIVEGDRWRSNAGTWIGPILRDVFYRAGVRVVNAVMSFFFSYNDKTLQNPKIVIYGSSTAAGYNLPTNETIEYLVRQWVNANGGGEVINISLSGANSSQFLPTGTVGIRVTDVIATNPDIVLFFAPTNDPGAGISNTTWINNILEIKRLLEEAGIRFFGQFVGPRDQYGLTEQNQLVNAAILFNNRPDFTYTIFDFYNSPLWIKTDPANPAKTNPVYYQSDLIHQNYNGTQYTVNNFVIPILTRELRPNTAYSKHVIQRSTDGGTVYSDYQEIADPQVIQYDMPKAPGKYRVVAYLRTGGTRISNVMDVTNASPTVNAGADQSLPSSATTATLAATASDPDGTIVSYLWQQTSGPTATIVSAASATTGITGLAMGNTYSFTCTVTDNNGATAVDSVVVAVAASTFVPYTILIDLGGNGTNTLNSDGVARGALTASPDANGRYWNNLSGLANGNGFRNGFSASNFVDTTGVNRNMGFVLNQNFYGTFVGGNNTYGINMYSGTSGTTGGGATVAVGPAGDTSRYPTSATQDSIFAHTSAGDTGNFTLNGWDALNTYEVFIWGARNDAGTDTRILQTRLAEEAWTAQKAYDARNNTTYSNGITYSGITGKTSQTIYGRAGVGVGTNNAFGYIGVIEIRVTRP